jgi:heat shock protein HslJ
MNKRHLIAGALSASLLVSALPGLAFAQVEGQTAAEAVQWQLGRLAGEPVPEGVETTLFLSGGEVVGNAGCNSYFGSYEIDDTSLTFPDPLGVTQMFCEGPGQDTEDAYLPLLQSTAGWSVADGILSLTDADGAVTLVYGEPPVEITGTDVAALTATLEDLQAQIDVATAEVAALTEAAASINVNKFDKRLTAVESSVTDLEKKTADLNVKSLKKRISANESAIKNLDNQVTNIRKRVTTLENTDANLKKRINALEKTNEDQEARIISLEEAVFVPTPQTE